MHSVSDLTTYSRKTTGDVPPKLVGASITVVGDSVYLFGGRLVAERRMVANMYHFDLETCIWKKITFSPEDQEHLPSARYFHSMDEWNNHLILFGGMGHRPGSEGTDDLCVLNDVRFFDLAVGKWLPASSSLSTSPNKSGDIRASLDTQSTDPSSVLSSDPSISPHLESSSTLVDPSWTPHARYAHLSAISSSLLFIIGGQDLDNQWHDDICVFDLRIKKWVHKKDYWRRSGTYRSVAVCGNLRVNNGTVDKNQLLGGTSGRRFSASSNGSGENGPVNPSNTLLNGEFSKADNFQILPFSENPTDEAPNNIFLYSNYNFTDVKRELEVISPLPHPLPSTNQSPDQPAFQAHDLSGEMRGPVLPPGLRFPTGAICGNYLIFAGTYLAHSYQSFSIWCLDLTTKQWTRIDPGVALSTGSWFKGVLWNASTSESSVAQSTGRSDKYVIFGNRSGNLVEDYNRRLLSWDDVAFIDLEAFGVYQPPKPRISLKAQELGLAALEEGLFADFDIICDDGRKIPCSRKMLEERWPWFKEQRMLLLEKSLKELEKMRDSNLLSETDVTLPPPGTQTPISDVMGLKADADRQVVDPRLTPRSFLLSEPYPVTLALLQYFYTSSLITPLQHAPAVLSQLLLLSSIYKLGHLQSLLRHAMHRALSPSTSVGVYEVATLCGCQSLQIRALKAVMSSSRRAPNNARNTTNGSGSGNANGSGGGQGHGGPSRETSGSQPPARPRGMSDAKSTGPRGPPASGASNSRQYGDVAPPDDATEIGHRANSSVDTVQGLTSVKSMSLKTNFSLSIEALRVVADQGSIKQPQQPHYTPSPPSLYSVSSISNDNSSSSMSNDSAWSRARTPVGSDPPLSPLSLHSKPSLSSISSYLSSGIGTTTGSGNISSSNPPSFPALRSPNKQKGLSSKMNRKQSDWTSVHHSLTPHHYHQNSSTQLDDLSSGWLDDAEVDVSTKVAISPGDGAGALRRLTESGIQKGRSRLASIGALGRGLR